MVKQKIDSEGIKSDSMSDAISYGNSKSSDNISNGWAGDELNSAEFYKKIVEKTAEFDNYLIDQGPSDSESALVIGPMRYTYSVQSIEIAEQRAISAPATTRSDKPVLVDSGSAYQKASISFIFNGEEEINKHLRALIILFKICPIISIENEMLTKAWSPKSAKIIEDVKRKLTTINANSEDQKLINQSYADFKDAIRSGKNLNDYLNSNKSRSFQDASLKSAVNDIFADTIFKLHDLDYIPVCLEDITIQTIPDIPGALNVTLGISHVDVTSSTENGVITYLGARPGTYEVNPRRAYWLKKWIRKILNAEYNSAFPKIGVGDSNYESAFGFFKLSFYDKAIGNLLPLTSKPEDLSINSTDQTKILSQSITIANKFAYQRLTGKSIPCVQHLGITANSLTLTIQFSDSETTLDRFMQFKELSDKLFRAESIIDRTMGWAISSPLVTLLGHRGTNVFLPLNINLTTSDIPNVKNCTITLLESNVEFKDSTSILLDAGGTPYNDLKAFLLGGDTVTKFDDLTQTTNRQVSSSFIGLMNYDNAFRNKVTSSNLASLILERSPEYQAHSVLFPKDNNGIEGIINRDSIRALLFSSKLNTSTNLREELLKLPLATGKISNSNLTLSKLEALRIGFWDIGLLGPSSLDSSRVNGIKDIARKIEAELFEKNSVETAEITELLLLSLFGLPENAIAAINKIKGSKIRLSNKFREALFDVVVVRPSPISLLSKTFDREGLYVAFNMLYLEYISSKDIYPAFDKDTKSTAINDSAWRQSCYPDIELPSYEELFGDSWQHFAPTYDDVGINYYKSRGTAKPINTSDNKQNTICVSAKDKVPPYVWFYNKKLKNELRSGLEANAEGYLSLAEKRYLSMNLRSIRQSELLRNLDKNKSAELERIANGNSLLDKDIKGVAQNLVEIITQAYSDDLGKIDISRFQEDLESTRDLVKADDKTVYDFENSKANKFKVFYQEYLHPNSPKKINLYFTTTGLDDDSPGGYVSSRFQVSPVAGAAYIRIMHELKYTIKNNGSIKDISPLHDEALTTVGAGNLDVQRRNQKENTLETVKSSLSQIPDDFNSMSKLWPAAKVYFLERRGNDLVADDVYYSTDSIISIDITDDKDDAALAVIKIADPLRYIQNSTFGAGNIVSQKTMDVNGEKMSPIVLGAKRAAQEGFIRQRKIEQGRPIQIRMGYGSNPDHLSIVFTGRITEVELGDELTIVAQSWKAELINRQVNFYSNNRKSWGAKDLVVQTIQLADPDGIGQHIPEKEANAIITKLRDNQEGVVANSLNNATDTILIKDAPSILTDITRLLHLDTLDIYDPDARKPGIDTRFKNIWYPDASKTINNYFKWRQFFGIHGPDFINDYWLVPLQPAWDVIKEASRHTWNYIAQVVPYDGEATLFFGHPDQLYYYTRGTKNKIDEWKKYASQKEEQLSDKIVRLVSDFRRWDDTTPTISFNDIQLGIDPIDIITNDIVKGVFKYSYKAFVKNIKNNTNVINEIKASGIAKTNIDDLDNILGTNSIPMLLYLFYGIKPNRLFLWPNYDVLIRTLLGPLKDGNLTLYDEIKRVDVPLVELLNTDIVAIGVSTEDLFSARDVLDELRLEIRTTTKSYIPSKDYIDRLKFYLKTKSSSINDLIENLNKATKNKSIGTRVDREIKIFAPKDQEAIKAIVALTNAIQLSLDSKKNLAFTPIYATPENITIEQLLDQSDYLFKVFIGYFLQFLKSTNQKEITTVGLALKDSTNFPNMKVFRVHHYIDSDKDIIENNIVATTSQMWNTVVINRPAENPADTTITDGPPLNQGTQVKTTVNWIYWPKPAVSKVIGLQFHPGISLANKKVKLCTELNCISDELAAKLACNNLAEGIKKMYRGTLTIRGRFIKPYDRIILNDRFNGMKGPIEVESVVHHFNSEVGWVTNIIPQAVCDSNPGAAIIQTAIMEANFDRVMNVVDRFFDAAYLGTILAAPGVGGALKAILSKGLPAVFNTSLKGSFGIITSSIKTLSSGLSKINYNPITAATMLANRYRGTAKLLFNSYILEKSIGSIAQHTSNFMLASSWAEGASDKNKAAQLPVILSPLIYNGAPWTAGLEADDIIFNIPFFDTYYNFHDLKTAFYDYIGAVNR